MNDIPPISTAAHSAGLSIVRPAAAHDRPAAEVIGDDQLEISDLGQTLSALDSGTSIRMDKVLRIRQEIADGTYETPEKIEATAERLLAVLREQD